MKPNKQLITIDTSKELIEEFLSEVIIAPRSSMRKWALITMQTPAAKLGYIGQHLASLITGIPGTVTGARGDDLADHTEVKSCNKVDQVDKCKQCGSRVMRMQTECPVCHSTNIKRNQDSKWLFTIRSEEDLQQYKNMDRVFLLLFDYPNFAKGDFSDIRIRSFEIYPKEQRGDVFCTLIDYYYHNIYLKKANDNKKKTNPMNLHPEMFQFYLCNPVKTFECIIHNIDTAPRIEINHFILPSEERNTDMQSELMPTSLLKPKEIKTLLMKAKFKKEVSPLLNRNITKKQLDAMSVKNILKIMPNVDERLRSYIPLRSIISVRQKANYQRV